MFALSRRNVGKKHVRRPSRYAPGLDVLEARELLATLTVTTTADDGPGSLRAQVVAAASGDTVDFAPTLVGQTITLTSGPIDDAAKDLTILGPGATKLTISGGGTTQIFRFGQAVDPAASAITVSVSGLTLADGRAADYGGAISASAASLAIDGVVFRDNLAVADVDFTGAGGAVSVFGADTAGGPPVSTVTVNDSKFLDNSAVGAGGAFQSFNVDVTITDTLFDGNSSPYGGALLVGGGSLNLIDSTVANSPQGGGLAYGTNFGSASSLNVSGTTFRGNATTGFGGAINSFGTTTITGSTFEDNAVDSPNFGIGGAIYVSGSLAIDSSRFADNRAGGATTSSGGAIYVSTFRTILLKDSVFERNEASGNHPAGGALYVESDPFGFSLTPPTLTISGSRFEGNRAVATVTEGFGGFAQGGAIVAQGFPGAMIIEGSTFRNNQAIVPEASPGGGFVQGGAISTSGGFFGPSSLLVTKTNFLGNQSIAGDGGDFGGFASGGAIDGLSNFQTAKFREVLFDRNSAVGGNGVNAGGGFGGALSGFGQAVTLEIVSFTNNVARGGDASDGGFGGGGTGGAISNLAPTVDLGLFVGNQAIAGLGGAAVGSSPGGSGGTAQGGAIQGYTSITRTSFLRNLALGGDGGDGAFGGGAFGGAITGKGDITDSSFYRNQAVSGDGGDAIGSGTGGIGGLALGGAVSTDGGTIQRTQFYDNVVRAGRGGKGGTTGTGGPGGLAGGGGVSYGFFGPGAPLVVLDSLFTRNVALGGAGGSGSIPGDDGPGFGGGIAIFDGTATIKRTKFVKNRASTEGNNIYGPYSS